MEYLNVAVSYTSLILVFSAGFLFGILWRVYREDYTYHELEDYKLECESLKRQIEGMKK